jgi:hypothetical protein
MIRPLLTEIGLFLIPFAVYALYLIATRTHILDKAAWSLRVLAGLSIAAMLLIIGSFLFFAHFSGAPPGSTYVPAHLENGKLVPGAEK